MSTKHNEAGKGSTRRPTDDKKFNDGWDRIWGKKNEDRQKNVKDLGKKS